MSISNFYRVTTVCLMATLTACGGGASGDLPAHAIKIAIQNEAPLGVCSSGGVTINSGTDANDNLVLQDAEITGTQYICNGLSGTTGATGATGTTGLTGLTGLTGINGTNGLSGASGLTALVVVSQELSGTNCTTGGSRVSAGFDTNRDNVLNTSEVTSYSFICNGFNGSEGANGNVGATGAAGTNGTDGATGAAGTNGATGATGAAGTNGLAGATGAAGATGSAGNNGAAGATGNDGVAGAAGSNGAAGATGLTSLVTIVTELPGVPCLSGGVVAKSGVDSNANNSLDALEVTSTTYICNGERGAIGATGAPGATGASGGDGATGPQGVTGAGGATGATGAQGVPGATGPAGGGLSAFGYFYTLSGQVVAVGSAVVFDSQIDSLNIEFGTAKQDIKVLVGGDYLVRFSVTGTESNQFALKVNTVVVPGSIYGSGAGTQQNNGQVIVKLGVGDVVNLVNNHSAAAVGLQSLSGGTERNVTASVTLLKLN